MTLMEWMEAKKGRSLSSLARMAKLSRGQVYRAMVGRGSIQSLLALAKTTGITMVELAAASAEETQVRRSRRVTGLTQAELGEKLGVSQTAVSNLEAGLRKPTPEILKKLEQLAKERA